MGSSTKVCPRWPTAGLINLRSDGRWRRLSPPPAKTRHLCGLILKSALRRSVPRRRPTFALGTGATGGVGFTGEAAAFRRSESDAVILPAIFTPYTQQVTPSLSSEQEEEVRTELQKRFDAIAEEVLYNGAGSLPVRGDKPKS